MHPVSPHLLRGLARLGMLAALALPPVAMAEEIPRIATILAVGDSITRHGPSEKLGWAGDWGMAASTREKDWAHLLLARVMERQGGTPPKLVIDAVGGGRIQGKLQQLAAITATKAELIVVQLGENENTPALVATFEKDYDSLVAALRGANPESRIICLGVWGGEPRKDGMIRRVCARHHAGFAAIAPAVADPANWAKADGRWTHPGVNWHPGDRGMEAYASAVWRVLVNGSDPEPGAATTATGSAVVLHEDWAAPPPAGRWTGAGTIDDGAWRIALETAGTAIGTTVLPTDRVAGQRLRISARVRAEGVTAKPKPWNGIKVQLAVSDAEERKDFPQAALDTGTFSWTGVEFVAVIPRNAVRVALNIGLEAVAGRVWFDDLHVEILAP